MFFPEQSLNEKLSDKGIKKKNSIESAIILSKKSDFSF